MQLLAVTKRTVTILLAMIVMAGVVAVRPAEADSLRRHGGNLWVHAHYEKDQNRTLCKVSDWRVASNRKKYRFYRPGKLEPRACYTYWQQNGHPGAIGKTKNQQS